MPKISKNASTIISLVLAVSFIVIFAVMMCIMPWFAERSPFFVGLREYFVNKDVLGLPGESLFIAWLYIIIAVAEACCIVVLLLLLRVRKGLVFTEKSVAYIRFVSWGCLLIGAVCLCVQYFHPLAFVLALAAAFLGLCLRVVKNVIEEATAIKNENDLTV